MSEASKKRLQDVILKAHDKAVSLLTKEVLLTLLVKESRKSKNTGQRFYLELGKI